MGIYLLADAGGTSVKWYVKDETTGTEYQFRVDGMSPLYLSEDEVEAKLREAFPASDYCQRVVEVAYYGAGCAPDQAPWRIQAALERLFPQAKVVVDSDMVGAARVLWGSSTGIVGIIGTGSNAGFYDGEAVSYARPSLGYILGDEGSGAWLGRHLLRDWLYGTLSPHLADAMFEDYGRPLGLKPCGTHVESTDPVMQRLFRGERPNQFLASFAPFLSRHINDPYCANLVSQGMQLYVTSLVLPNVTETVRELKMVGSVAYAFQDQLGAACSLHGIELRQVKKDALP